MLQSILTASVEVLFITSIAYFTLMFIVGYSTRPTIAPEPLQTTTEADAPDETVKAAEEPVTADPEPDSYAAATIAPEPVLVVMDEPAPRTRRELLAIAKERQIPNSHGWTPRRSGRL